MKSTLRAKLLQHFLNKKKEGGFTLIELLVVIIIIGILAAIALPSFLNQANKAKQSEAKTYVGSMNRGQQAYYLENSEFGTDLSQLGLGIASTTTNYAYLTDIDTSTAVNTGTPTASSDTNSLKAYVGGVALGKTSASSDEFTTLAVLCESLEPTTTAGGATDVGRTVGDVDDTLGCTGNFKSIK